MLTTEGLARKGLPLEDFDRLCLAVLRARIEAHRIYAAKLCGHYDDIAARDPLFAGIVSTEMPTLPGMPQELFARSIASIAAFWIALSWNEGRRPPVPSSSSGQLDEHLRDHRLGRRCG